MALPWWQHHKHCRAYYYYYYYYCYSRSHQWHSSQRHVSHSQELLSLTTEPLCKLNFNASVHNIINHLISRAYHWVVLCEINTHTHHVWSSSGCLSATLVLSPSRSFYQQQYTALHSPCTPLWLLKITYVNFSLQSSDKSSASPEVFWSRFKELRQIQPNKFQVDFQDTF